MKKDNQSNGSDLKTKDDAKKASASDTVVAPDYSLPNTSAPNSGPNPPASLSYGKDAPEKKQQKVKGETPGNDVEASLNPDKNNLEDE